MPTPLAHLQQNFRNIFPEGVDPTIAAAVHGNQLLPSTSNKHGYNSFYPQIGDEEEESEHYLNPVIWGEMPESVLHLIFSRLPIKSTIRLRSLNKHWNCTDFLSNNTTHQQGASQFALVKKKRHHNPGKNPFSQQEVWLLDSRTHEWCKFHIGSTSPFPSSSSSSSSSTSTNCSRDDEDVLELRGPFATAGGLLCYAKDPNQAPNSRLELLICNPMTQTWRQLPPTLTLSEFPDLVHMAMMTPTTEAASTSRYCITLVGRRSEASDGGGLVIEVYDSGSDAWSQAEKPPRLFSYYRLFEGEDYKGLATIDTDTNRIRRLMYPPALQPRSCLEGVYGEGDKCWIMESQGSLFMCCNAPKKEGIWQRLEVEWCKVCAFPKVLRQYERTSLFLTEEVVLLLGTEPLHFAPQCEDLEPHQLVMYEKASHKWSVLPRISARFGDVEDILGGFVFEPRFDTRP